MSEKMPALMPMIAVRDPQATIAWLEKLGFRQEMTMPAPDGSIAHAEVTRSPELRFMLGPARGEVGSAGLELYVTLEEDIDALYRSATAAGVTADSAPQDQFWGDRTFTAIHPDGYRIMFARHVRDVSMEEMEQAMAQFVPA